MDSPSEAGNDERKGMIRTYPSKNLNPFKLLQRNQEIDPHFAFCPYFEDVLLNTDRNASGFGSGDGEVEHSLVTGRTVPGLLRV
ncbi:hypothetical protein [Litorimonas haliclonae]|uniref:hypothetical protein n=1 Tax=Litorimonas haliclonae TaxID=2081977 RepID=UPI0039F031AE